jgi:hypothetical protein
MSDEPEESYFYEKKVFLNLIFCEYNVSAPPSLNRSEVSLLLVGH